MSAGTTLIGLLLYPIIFGPRSFADLFPLLNASFEPPPQTPEVADDRQSQVAYFALALMVVVLLRLSGSPLHAVGFTRNNWQLAVSLGALASSFPLAFSRLLDRLLTLEQRRAEPLGRGSLPYRCGTLILRSVSTEVWRAFCMVSLMHVGFNAFVCVLVVAFVYGIPSLTTSVAKALGAATFGCVAGFLFIGTDSIYAPLTLSLIGAGAELYRARRGVSRVRWDPGNAKISCPRCCIGFEPAKDRKQNSAFHCPKCGERLRYADESDHSYVWFVSIVTGVPILISLLASQYRDWVYLELVGLALAAAGAGIYMRMTSPVRPPFVLSGDPRRVGPTEKKDRLTDDSPPPR